MSALARGTAAAVQAASGADAAAVDALLPVPAVVFGSLPPEGRDLDLLVTRHDLPRVRDALRSAGWLVAPDDDETFVRFAGGTAFVVDLVCLEGWAASTTVAARVVRQASPLPGFSSLRVPAPHHRLLVLARRAAAGMRLDERRRAFLAVCTAEQWEAAAAEAPEWGCAAAVAALRRGEAPVPAARPLVHRARRAVAAGRWLPTALRSEGAHVVALSGLDGAGKSTQAEHLQTALEALGYDVTIVWTKIARDAVLAQVAQPVKQVLSRVARLRRGGAGPVVAAPAAATAATAVTAAAVIDDDVDETGERRNYPYGRPAPPDAGGELRRRQPVLTWGWTFVVAWANGRTHRAVARSAGRDAAGRPGTRVVVCDRYVLDSRAHLRYRYAPDRRLRLQGGLVRLLSLRTALAVLLDVAPATARARKPEQYTTADLVRLRELYLDEAGRMPVAVLDGQTPELDLAADVARRAWEALAR